MRFPSMLRRLRNTQGGMGSTAKSAPAPYPYVPVPPPDPEPPDTRSPTVTILVSPSVPYREFDVVFSWSEIVIGFTQSDVKLDGISRTEVAWEEDENQLGRRFILTIRPGDTHGGDLKFIVPAGRAQDAAGNWNEKAEKTTTVQPDTYTFTNLPPGTPQPTYPYPQGTYFPYDPSTTVPDPPEYAVPIRRPDAPVPEPVLTVQAERKHSPFEKHIARTIFENSPSFTDEIFNKKLTIYVDPLLTSIDPINHSTTYPNATHGDGRTGISRAKFPYTPAFDGNTTLDDFTTAELNSPGMLQFIWSFVHELAHWWQNDQNRQDHTWDSGYREQQDRYRFNEAQLVANKFVDFEAHASAVATYAVIKWQLENRPEGQLINLTKNRDRGHDEEVGSVERYMKIRGMDFQASGRDHTTSPPVGTWITREDAKILLSDFSALVTEITTASPLPEPDEE